MTIIERVTNAPSERGNRFRLSFLAYLGPLVMFSAALLLGFGMSFFSWTASSAFLAGAFLLTLYRLWWLHSVELYTDTEGVWVFRGVLPWARGVYGVKWGNLDEATYVTGLVSWATKSFRIKLCQRFTQAEEISLSHVARGDLAVAVINDELQARMRAGVADVLAVPENAIVRDE